MIAAPTMEMAMGMKMSVLAAVSLRDRSASTANASPKTVDRPVTATTHQRLFQITPRSVEKGFREGLNDIFERDYVEPEEVLRQAEDATLAEEDLRTNVDELRRDMLAAAEGLDFEKAARLRDRIFELEARALGLPTPGSPNPPPLKAGSSRGGAKPGRRRRR